MERNNTGSNNTADGINTLLFATASNNTAIGGNALLGTTTGANNTALGFNAGRNLTTRGNNIDIGNAGLSADSGTIRIGTQGMQTATFITGIFGKTLTGSDVVVTSGNQLGVSPSSARYKRDIHDMGEASGRLMKLRPVSFRYKNDPQGTIQYGLVAEEVEQVYPELVTYGPDGKVETVRYSMLSAMLLNELKKQVRENALQAQQLKKLSAQMLEMNAKVMVLEQAMRTNKGEGKLAAAR